MGVPNFIDNKLMAFGNEKVFSFTFIASFKWIIGCKVCEGRGARWRNGFIIFNLRNLIFREWFVGAPSWANPISISREFNSHLYNSCKGMPAPVVGRCIEFQNKFNRNTSHRHLGLATDSAIAPHVFVEYWVCGWWYQTHMYLMPPSSMWKKCAYIIFNDFHIPFRYLVQCVNDIEFGSVYRVPNTPHSTQHTDKRLLNVFRWCDRPRSNVYEKNGLTP